MGRRALPKASGNIDVGDYLKSIDDLKPWDPSQWFGETSAMEIEVGCGKGLFIASAAAEHPDRSFLGIEIAKKYAHHCAARLKKQACENAIMMQGDAQPLFKDVIPDQCIDGVHVYFPDPWWKRRHRKRRIMNKDFIADAYRVLKADGQLHFWTDVKEYFDVTLDLLDSYFDFKGPIEVCESQPAHDMDYRTHFERRMRMHNEPIYRSQFVK